MNQLRLKVLTQEFRDTLYQLKDDQVLEILAKYPEERERLRELTAQLDMADAVSAAVSADELTKKSPRKRTKNQPLTK